MIRRHSNRALDLANLPIKLPNVIFAIVAPVAGLPFVAGQGIVIFLLDVGVPARGLEIVPPRMVRGLPTIGDTDPLTNPPADRFGAVSCPAAKSILGDAGKDSRFQTRGAASLRGCTRTRGDMGRPRSSLQKNRPPPPNSPAKRGAKWSIIGVQIGCDRGCKSRRNAGFRSPSMTSSARARIAFRVGGQAFDGDRMTGKVSGWAVEKPHRRDEPR